jgi:serine/threonine protein phosphatase 1
MPRTIAIGDIHGCADALDRLLREIAPQSSDVVIGLGDYVDRGVDSARVIEMLIGLVSQCRFIPLIGNHELMMVKALRNDRDFEFWFQYGGSATLASYGGRKQNIPQHHLTFLGHCIRFFETNDHFFVHANYDPYLPLPAQNDISLFWEHVGSIPPAVHCSGKRAIVGHTPQLNGVVRNLGHLVVLDTFCYGDQWLTAMDVDSGEIWQANNRGELRTSLLPEPEAIEPSMDDQFTDEYSD